jgi:hypothetical protein
MADFQQMGGVPDFYGQLLNQAQQGLVRLPDGSYAPSPQYGQQTNVNDIYAGIIPNGGIPPIGLQGSKVNRGQASEFYQPPITQANQTAYRNGTTGRDIIRDIPALPTQTASGYSSLDTIDPLNINNLGLTRQSFFAKGETPAERAIAEVTINGGMQSPSGGSNRGRAVIGRRPTTQLPTMPDPLLEEGDPWAGLRIGGGRPPSRPGMATGTPGGAPAPQQQRGGGLLGMLLGALGGGSGGQGGGLASLLSGGGPATGQQLASMQQAAQTAQDPALAAALAAGNKSYVPTNGDPTGVLGYGALMPTVAMNGNPIRNR